MQRRPYPCCVRRTQSAARSYNMWWVRSENISIFATTAAGRFSDSGVKLSSQISGVYAYLQYYAPEKVGETPLELGGRQWQAKDIFHISLETAVLSNRSPRPCGGPHARKSFKNVIYAIHFGYILTLGSLSGGGCHVQQTWKKWKRAKQDRRGTVV